MAKLGTEKKPIRVRVQSEGKMMEIASICEDNGWQFIGKIAPDEPEDTVEFEYMLNPDAFNKEPHITHPDSDTVIREGLRIGRNDPCPCGSGLKYKNCCMNKE